LEQRDAFAAVATYRYVQNNKCIERDPYVQVKSVVALRHQLGYEYKSSQINFIKWMLRELLCPTIGVAVLF